MEAAVTTARPAAYRALASGVKVCERAAIAADFLRAVWRFDEACPFERFRLHERGERFPEWAIKGTDDLYAIAAEVCEQPGDVYFLPHALHFSGRTNDHITQFNAVCIDFDGRGLDGLTGDPAQWTA